MHFIAKNTCVQKHPGAEDVKRMGVENLAGAQLPQPAPVNSHPVYGSVISDTKHG